jgi:hypothetical protein
MPDMVLDVIFGVVAIAIGLYLLVRRTTLVGIAQERGRGIRSMTTHTIIAVVLVLVGIWSLLAAFDSDTPAAYCGTVPCPTSSCQSPG